MRSAGCGQQDSRHGEGRQCAIHDGERRASGIRRASFVIGELEEAFLRACPSYEPHLKRLREDHKLFGADMNAQLTQTLDQLGFHLGSTAKVVPSDAMIQVLKVVERVLCDGSEQQKWAVTHFLMPALQNSIKAAGSSADALLPLLGPATANWWNDLAKNPHAVEDWK